MLHTLLLLIAGHALCDYPLQGDFLAKAKNHKLGRCSCGKEVKHVKADFWAVGPEVCLGGHWHKPANSWGWKKALFAHSSIHAGMVLLVTGSLVLAFSELVIHAITDWLKCDERIGSNTDQAIHYACKILWVLILLAFPHLP